MPFIARTKMTECLFLLWTAHNVVLYLLTFKLTLIKRDYIRRKRKSENLNKLLTLILRQSCVRRVARCSSFCIGQRKCNQIIA